MKKIIISFYNCIINIYYQSIGYYSSELKGYTFKLNYENRKFWKQASNDKWENNTFIVLSKFLDKNSIYIDMGAWIGPTVIYAAKKCKKVICFEPDPVAYRRLLSNIYFNKLENVISYNIALSDTSSIKKMASLTSGLLGDSTTSLLSNINNNSTSFEALVLDWNFFENIYNFNKVDVIKIDIEGSEFFLIPKLEKFFIKHRPVVWLSIHVPFLEENKKLEELQKLINVMKKCYKICLNSKLEPFDINELPNDEKIKLKATFLFKN